MPLSPGWIFPCTGLAVRLLQPAQCTVLVQRLTNLISRCAPGLRRSYQSVVAFALVVGSISHLVGNRGWLVVEGKPCFACTSVAVPILLITPVISLSFPSSVLLPITPHSCDLPSLFLLSFLYCSFCWFNVLCSFVIGIVVLFAFLFQSESRSLCSIQALEP